jgi:hypothetical protein
MLWGKRLTNRLRDRESSEFGFMITLSSVRKLAAKAPDTKEKFEFVVLLKQQFPKY